MSEVDADYVEDPQLAKKSILKRPSTKQIGGVLVDTVQEKIQDQDFMQRVSIFLVILLELYRVLVSSLLIVFVPQNCNGHLCTIKENLESNSITYIAGLIINFVTLAVFGTMYIFEIWREHLLIEYLEVNPKHPNRNSFVETALAHLAPKKKDRIKYIVGIYQMVGACAIFMYVINAILSAVVISGYYLGNQTVTSFITNLLFMIQKFIDVYFTISSEPNVFLSAYLRAKIQFNDVDPDHRGIDMGNTNNNDA